MSSGALIQLVAYGAQDLYLTGTPQISFWKTVYLRHTNYAMESIQVPISGSVRPGSKVTVNIPKSGDLLKRLWIHYNPSQLIPAGNPTNVEYICSDLGHSLFNRLEFEIGGQIIDVNYGKWLSIWRDLNERNPYGSAESISNIYPNYTPSLPLLNEYQNGNMFYMTTQGEEPPCNYVFTSKIVNENNQSVTFTNNNGTSNGNSMVSGAASSDPNLVIPPSIIPINQRSRRDFTTMYDIMGYTHIGTQNINQVQAPGVDINILNLSTANAPTEAYIPLQFWFCKHPGLALPLIALQYHEVKFHMSFADTSMWVKPYPNTSVVTNISSIKVFAEYIYLDSTERKQFAQNAHEYLIDQLQLQTINNKGTSEHTASFNIEFNHPVKELIITGNPEYYVANNKYDPTYGPFFDIRKEYLNGRTAGGATPAPIISSTQFPNDYGSPVSQTNTRMNLSFNAIERFFPRNLKYFTREQIYEHHSKSGGGHYFTDDIGVYSFALKPSDKQPSGTCNMSRIDRVTMNFTNINTVPGYTERLQPLDVYAVNHNVLRIMSGMGGLAYSN